VSRKNCNNPMFVAENRQCRGVLELNGHAPPKVFHAPRVCSIMKDMD